jgi:hypothetical protein
LTGDEILSARRKAADISSFISIGASESARLADEVWKRRYLARAPRPPRSFWRPRSILIERAALYAA